MDRIIPFTSEHHILREAFGKFLDNECVPYYDRWEKDGVPREIFKKFGDYGYLCPDIEEEYGGAGADYLHNVIQSEELHKRGLNSIFTRLHQDIVAPYIHSYGTEKQKRRWLPGICSGDTILAIAMTEPGAGSDLQAIRTKAVKQGDYYVLNGTKTFISNGINSNMIVVACKTDTEIKPRYKGISLLVVEQGMEGFERGRKLQKVGMHGQDTAELFFDNVKVPKENLLGEEGKGFYYLMEKLQGERLSSAIASLSKAEYSLNLAIRYVKERELFGTTLSKFQNTQFEIAKAAVDIQLGRSFVDQLILDHMAGKDIVQEVSMAKYWCANTAFNTSNRMLQLHGGYGYMSEYPIGRQFCDTRVDMIMAGTMEVQLNIIAKRLGL